MAKGRMVKNMHGFYRAIAFGVFVVLYMAIVLVIKTYAIAIRLFPMKAKDSGRERFA